MKKTILSLVAGVSALFTFGAANAEDAVTLAADFEIYSAGTQFDASLDEAGVQDGYKYWFSTSEVGDIGVISNYEGTASASTPIANRPLADSNSKYLWLDTSSPLYRTIQPNEQTMSFVDFAIPADGVYLDTLVQFTAAEEALTELDNGDKIAISYVENEGDPAADPVVEGWTNFVVRAGYLMASDTVVETNYFVNVPADFDKTAWHRLTVRAIPEIGNGFVGFVVYLDGKELTYSLDQIAAVDGVWTPGAMAQAFYNSEIHAIFPSAIQSGDNKAKIAAASFSGTGAIDDVVFTTVAPGFISTDKFVTLAWSDGVAALSVTGTKEGTFTTNNLTEAGSVTLTLESDSTALTVAATYDEANGYVAAPWGAEKAELGVESNFVDIQNGAVLTVNAQKPLFEVNGVYFDDPEAAVAALSDESGDPIGTIDNPSVFKLMGDYDSALAFDSTCGYVVLDLNGCDVQGAEEQDFSLYNNGAYLTVTNSGAEASILMPKNELATILVYNESGYMTLQAGTYEGYVYDEAGNGLSLTGGKYLDIAYDGVESTDFYLADCVVIAGNYKYLGDKYFQVGEAAEPPEPPTTYTVTVAAAPEHATVTVLSNGVDIVYAASYTLNQEDTLKVTYAIAEGDEEAWEFAQDAVVEFTITKDSESKAVAAPTVVEKQVEPTTYAVSFYTNAVAVANLVAVTNIEDGATLTADEIPAIFGKLEGTWDNDPVGAVITEATNFVFTIAAPEPTTVDITIPAVVEGGSYIVSNATEQIVASSSDEEGGSVYTLTIGESYKIYAVAAVDYEVVGTNPYEIGEVTAGTTVDPADLPTFQAVTPTPSWDIPGVEGGINAFVDPETSEKSVEFTSIEIVDGKIKVGLKAAKIDADGQTFGLICKEDLTKDDTITINVILTDDKSHEATLADLAGETTKTQLFVIGIGPAAKPK